VTARPAARIRSRSRATLRSLGRLLNGLNGELLLGGGTAIIFVLAAIFAPAITPYSPDHGDLLSRLEQPGGEHMLGTDALGRDLLTRLVYGSRVSLMVGLGAVAAAAIAGIPLGILAGYLQGRVDDILMRGMDILLAVPNILIAILIMAVSGPGIGNLILAIGLWNIPVFARIARSTTLSLTQRDFVMAAKALGNRPYRVMLFHVFPNTLGELLVIASLSIAGAIMAESGLSFLGLGVPPHVPSWGMIISQGRDYLRSAPYITTYAGLCIMLAVLGFSLLGDGLRDMLDPQAKGRRR
jgi:peptide/nickel transport system permease protein